MKTTRFLAVLSFSVFISPLLQASPSRTSIPVSGGRTTQNYPTVIWNADGSSTLIWKDFRGGPLGQTLYMQKVGPDGTPQWKSNGRQVIARYASSRSEYAVSSVSDGGFFVAWHVQEYTPGQPVKHAMYVQKVSADGQLQWNKGGVKIGSEEAVCSYSMRPAIAADGNGGAVVAWDHCAAGSSFGVSAQKLDSDGIPQWADGGVSMPSGTAAAFYPQIVSDHEGGAVLAYLSHDGAYTVKLQRLNAEGALLWGEEGKSLEDHALYISTPILGDATPPLSMIDDESGSVVAAWVGLPNDGESRLLAQKIDIGTGNTVWNKTISGAGEEVGSFNIARNEGHDLLFAWHGYAGDDHRIYGQQVTSSGADVWPAPVLVSSGTRVQAYPQVVFPRTVSDGNGGAFILWQYAKQSSSNPGLVGAVSFYAQRIGHAGDLKWNLSGNPAGIEISSRPDFGDGMMSSGAYQMDIASNGAGQALFAWSEHVPRDYTDDNIYMQKADLDGGNITPSVTFVAPRLRGWNMISVPVRLPENSTAAETLPLAPAVFKYEGVYREEKGKLQNGTGYWAKFPEGQFPYEQDDVCVFIGQPVEELTVPVRARWNVVGTVNAPILRVRDIVKVPSDLQCSFWKYSSSRGFEEAGYLEAGRGYFVKANKDGEIQLSAGAASKSVAGGDDPLASLGTLAVQDKNGSGQVLYFKSKADPDFRGEDYDSPPPSPAGTLQARFKTGRLVEIADRMKSVPVEIASDDYPLTISWTPPREGGSGVSLSVDGAEIPLTENGSTKILRAGSDVRLKFGAAAAAEPNVFALRQNYPNPFNPATVIRYRLAAEERVSLNVYNTLGQKVAALVDAVQGAGLHEVTFDAGHLPSGVYFYRLTAGALQADRKMILQK